MEKKGKIYKLYCDDGHYYYGSSSDKYLCKRLAGHKSEANKPNGVYRKVYTHINKIGWDRVKIVLVEEFEYTTREDMRKRENEYITKSLTDELCLNHNRSIVSEEERLQLSKEYKQKKREANKEIVKCDCGLEVSKGRYNQHINSVKHKLLMK